MIEDKKDESLKVEIKKTDKKKEEIKQVVAPVNIPKHGAWRG